MAKKMEEMYSVMLTVKIIFAMVICVLVAPQQAAAHNDHPYSVIKQHCVSEEGNDALRLARCQDMQQGALRALTVKLERFSGNRYKTAQINYCFDKHNNNYAAVMQCTENFETRQHLQLTENTIKLPIMFW